MKSSFINRPALSLLELVIFLALFAIAGGAIFSVFFTMNDQRIQQETASSVERTGLQILQTLTGRIASSERILDPALGSSGAVLTLQTSEESDSPVIIALVDEAIAIVTHASIAKIGVDATVTEWRVWNISPVATRLSVRISFEVSKAIPFLMPPRLYTRHFDTIIPLFPDDVPTGGSCMCDPPTCTSGVYHWNICDDSVCTVAPVTVPCG